MPVFARIALLIAAIGIGIGAAVSLWVTVLLTDTLEREIDKNGTTLSRIMESPSINNISRGDAIGQTSLLKRTKGRDPSIEYIYVFDLKGDLFAHTFQKGLPAALVKLQWPDPRSIPHLMRHLQTPAGEILHISHALIEGTRARVHIGINHAPGRAEIHRIQWQIIGISIGISLIAILIGLYFSRRLTRPLNDLVQVAGAFGRNEDIPAEMLEAGDGGREIVALRDAFRRMIDERGASEARLREGAMQLKAIADTLPASIALIGSDFKYRFVNKPTADWFGRPVEAFKGHHVSEVMPEELFRRVEGDMKKAMAGERISDERTSPHRQGFGDDRIASVNYVPYRDETGNVVGLLSMVEDITERRSAERAMREQEAQLASVMDHAADGIITIDTKGSIESFNKSAETIFGYAAEEVVGKNVRMLMGEPHRANHDDYVAAFMRTGEGKIIGSGAREVTGLRKDGSEVPLDLGIGEMRTETAHKFIASLRDITERKRAEEENQRYARILDASSNEIYVSDANTYRFIHVNESARRNNGFSMEELRELTTWEINPNYNEDSFKKALEPLQDGTTELLIFETTRQRKDGTSYPAEVQCQFFKNEDPPVFLSVIQDITERKMAEDEIVAMNRNLEQRIKERTRDLAGANEELQGTLENLRKTQDQLVESEKMASLGGLVAGIAHEINTPIGIGVTAASHLREGVEDLREKYDGGQMTKSALEQHLTTAEQSTAIVLSNLTRASDLIKSFKQVAVDQSSEEERRFGLRGYLDEIVTSLRPNLKKAGHEVAIDCDAGLTVEIYPGAVSQVVTNLIMNAITHAYDDGESGKMHIRAADRGDGMATLTFRDDGKGIPKENLARIFDPFFTTRRGSGGSGLGLNIGYNLVTQKLGGTITCSSEVGSGTTFDISFPKNVEDAHVGASEERRLAV